MGKITSKPFQKFLLLIIFLSFSFVSVAQQMDLRGNTEYTEGQCPANDIEILSAMVDLGSACNDCVPGSTITGDLIITVRHGTNSPNRFLAVMGDLTETLPGGGSTMSTFAECSGPLETQNNGNSGIQELNFGQVTFMCGSELVLDNILLVWTAANGECPVTPANNPNGKYCYANPTINITPPLNAMASASCTTGDNVDVDLTVQGGVMPFTYLWNNGATTEDLTDVAPGTYSVTATGADGCTAMTSITVGPALAATSTSTDVLCFGDDTGAIDLLVSGGVAPLTFLWDSGQVTEDISGLAAGDYSVTITDGLGCEITENFTIVEPTELTCSVVQDNPASSGNSDGEATVTALEGTPTYTYLWDNGESTQTATALNGGVHSVTVTDANGCETTCEVTIQELDPLECLITLVQDEQCFGDADGSAIANPVGGVAPFTYLWDNGETVQTAIGLAQGLHTVTVTDANGAMTDCDITIGGPAAALAADAIAVDVLCFGELTGSVDLTVTGGTTAYTYVWDNGAATEDLTDVAAGTYNVTITDANGCTTTASATVGQPAAALAADAVAVDVLCFGELTGSVDLTVSGGTIAYTYLWSNGATTEDLTSVAAGTYDVTITDANGCETTASATVSEPAAALTCSTVLDSGVSVNGASDGSATVTAVGGTVAYTYLWDNGETTEQAIGLDAGLHVVTVTDANGCETECEVTVTQPDVLSCGVVLVQDEQCFGDSDGSATANPVGGVAPFTYLWDNGETVQTAIGLAQGLHTVTVTDANGATTDCDITIGGPSAVLSADAIAVDVLCFDELTGSVDLTVTGGTIGYTYLWTTGATTEDLTDVGTGTYDVTITDANGCETTASATVTGPAAGLSASVITVDVLCFGELTGSVDLIITGGTQGYTYLWSNGATTEDLADVAAGTYDVTITDANGCETTGSATVGQPAAALTCSIVLDSGVSVNGASDGSATVTAVGGTSDYTYLWDNGEITQQAIVLNAGVHTVTVSDANGCITTCEVTIPEPDVLSCSVALDSDALCNGESNGSATVNPTGGVMPYTYLWDNGETVQTAIGLNVGVHLVTVTDANGATTTCDVTIAEPLFLYGTTTQVDVSCFGEFTGSIDLTVIGGTATYTYLWSNGATTEDLADVAAGTYDVTITDANGCETTASATVNEPAAALAADAIATDVLCFGELTGSVDLTVTGGTIAYTYLWDNGATTEDLTDLAAGTYNVTITDANGCDTTASATVGQPAEALTCSIVLDSGVSVNGASDGSATVTPVGGTAGYSYLWDNGETTEQATGLDAGDHMVTVTDANGCETTCMVTVTQPDVLSCSVALEQDEQCFGDEDGSATALPVGGVAPYTYVWGNGETTQTATGLAQGLHTVTVTDANGAITDCEITIGGPSAALAADGIAVDVLCFGELTGSVDLTVTGGTTAYTYLWSNGATTEDLAEVAAGTYNVTITDANGCTTTASAAVGQPAAALAADAIAVDVLCFGELTGSVDLTVTGGTTAYTYVWDNGATTEDLADVAAGTYNVTITDANGCTTTASATVSEPAAALTCSTVLDSGVSVNGASDGSATVTSVGGTAAYTYLWDNGETTEQATGLDAGLHVVTVTDANGCETECEVTVTEPDVLSCGVVLVRNVLCFEDSTGSATANPVGGVAPFTYLWDNGETVRTAIALNAGLHSVTVTDANGATTDCEIMITEPKPADAGDDNEVTVCDGTLVDLTLLVTVDGGSFSEDINTGGLDGTNFDTTGLSPGTYEVIYTVEAGVDCPVDTATITINVDELVDAGGDKELAVCESTVIDLSTLVDFAGGTFTPQGDGLSGSTLDTSGFDPGEYMYTYTIDANGECPGDTATISIMISEDIIDKECKVIDADFCDSSTDPFYNFYWGAMNSVSGSAFFQQDATHTLSFTQFNNGTAVISGTTQQNGCSAELYIFLEDKKDWDQWTADGGNFKAQGCAGTIKEVMDYYVIDGSRSWVKTTGDCVEEGTFKITQRPDPNDMSTPNLGVHVGPGGALWDSNQGADGLAGWAWMGPQGDEQKWKIDFNFLLDCEEKVGCIINDPDALDCEVSANVEDVDCNGGNDGSATVMVTGGLPPYSYAWSNGETSMTAMNLTAGTHTITVTDSENTTTQCSVTIAQPELLECTVALVNGVSAIGLSDGSATVTPTGGTANFTYLWGNGETTQTATSLSAGTNMVTVTDENGCETNCSVDIPEPGMLACEATGTDVSCYDGSDGTATVTPIGGLAPYSYSWSNGDTTQTITGLTAGMYTVIATDANGRDSNCEVEISQPLEDLSCMALAFLNVSDYGGSDGKATVTPEGGTLPYTYLWDNGETAAMAEALDAGIHTVTVTDANGCMTECSVEIMQPNPPALECEIAANVEDVSCNGGNDGSATVMVTGGVAPYTYLWSNAETTMTVTNLTVGTHTVTVVDSEDTVTECSVTIAEPELLECTVALVNGVSASSLSDGSATVTPTGGTASFTYLWDNNETTQTATSLSSGTHMVTVTDANGCETNCSVVIPEPGMFICEVSGTDVSCYDGSDGTATVTPNGGLAPYTYSWSNGDTTQTITGLVAGTYSVTVSDANGRATDCEITIEEPAMLTAEASEVSAVSDTGEEDGVATVTANGGSLPYTYLWDNGETTQTATMLSAGIHTVVVTDVNGCEAEAEVTITEPGMFACEVLGTDVSCYDGSDGTAMVTPNGGLAPYTYSWSNGDTTQSITGLAAGTYSVTVSDANGRDTDCEVEISQPMVDLSCAITDVINSNEGENNGEATASPSGGTAPYTYLWNDSQGQTTVTATGLAPDNYIVTITDANGCETSCMVAIEEIPDGGPATGCETAFARDAQANTCFLDDGFNRWGWTNYFENEGDYMLDLYSGAGQCDLTKGEKSGNVQVAYNGGTVTVTIEMLDGFVMQEAQLYVGGVKYPTGNNGRPTVAPGQYTQVKPGLNDLVTYEFDPIDVSGGIHVIVHVNTCKKSNDAGKVVKTAVTAYPMTFKNDLNLKVDIPYDAQLKVEMFDVNGRCILSKKGMNVKSGSNNVHLNVSGLSPDMYILIIDTGKERILKKILSKK